MDFVKHNRKPDLGNYQKNNNHKQLSQTPQFDQSRLNFRTAKYLKAKS